VPRPLCGTGSSGSRQEARNPWTPLSPIFPGWAFALVIFSALVHPLPVCCGSSVYAPLPRSPGGSAYLCSLLLCLYCYPAWSIIWSFGGGPPGFVPLTVPRRVSSRLPFGVLLSALCRPFTCRPLGPLDVIRVPSPGRFCTIPSRVSSSLPSRSLNS
jgi:hypothetical protein